MLGDGQRSQQGAPLAVIHLASLKNQNDLATIVGLPSVAIGWMMTIAFKGSHFEG
jgi:hypothetical protein